MKSVALQNHDANTFTKPTAAIMAQFDGSYTIRPAVTGDIATIARLVDAVASELYANLFEIVSSAETDPAAWAGAWVAVQDEYLIGVGLATGNYIDDLWIKAGCRSRNVGSALLRRMEQQISAQGHGEAWLRVVAANDGARRFYIREGWVEMRSYPHETLNVEMVDMRKELTAR